MEDREVSVVDREDFLEARLDFLEDKVVWANKSEYISVV